VKEIDDRELLAGDCSCREIDTVRHVVLESGREKRDVLHGYAGSEAGTVGMGLRRGTAACEKRGHDTNRHER
jgi:hypothetical protein